MDPPRENDLERCGPSESRGPGLVLLMPPSLLLCCSAVKLPGISAGKKLTSPFLGEPLSCCLLVLRNKKSLSSKVSEKPAGNFSGLCVAFVATLDTYIAQILSGLGRGAEDATLKYVPLLYRLCQAEGNSANLGSRSVCSTFSLEKTLLPDAYSVSKGKGCCLDGPRRV